jgi:hypothetical protein
MSGGMVSSRWARSNAQRRNAVRKMAGSGAPWSFLTRTGVTAVKVSTAEIRDLPAAVGPGGLFLSQAGATDRPGHLPAVIDRAPQVFSPAEMDRRHNESSQRRCHPRTTIAATTQVMTCFQRARGS